MGDKKEEAKFSPGPAASYASKQTNEGVTIAVKAFDNEELAHSAFGKVNPYQYGILPVLVIVQNDTDQSLRLEGLDFEYETFNGGKVDATPAADVPYAAEGPRRPAQPGSSPWPIPEVLKKKHKNPLGGGEIQSRAFSAKMLPPHDKASGFVYFQTPHRPGDSMYISGIQFASSGKALFYFEIPFKD